MICITGGSGFIGKILVEKLAVSGRCIRLLTRKKMLENSRCSYFIADLVDTSTSLIGFLDNVDVIYHCAGECNNLSLMHALHVDGTARLLEAVRLQIRTTGKPIHWVQLSSVGAYGPPKGAAHSERVVLETSPTNPIGDYEVTKTLADELVIDFARTEKLFSFSILRPSNVVGAMMPNQSVRALVKVIRKRLFFYVGSRTAVATYIHVDDVVDALILCGTNSRARGEIFNLSNDCALAEIVDAVAFAAGIPPPSLCVPEMPLRILVKVLSPLVNIPLTQERIDALVKRTYYPTKSIEETLGFVPLHQIPSEISSMF